MSTRTGPGGEPAGGLEIRGLGKSFPGQTALTGVDLAVGAGTVHAVIGENGSGKSTLIKILSGYHHPDPGGSVQFGGRLLEFAKPESSAELGLRFVHQDLGLIESATVTDNLYLESGFATRFGTIRHREARRRARADLARVGLDLDPGLTVADLSPALKTGVAIARALRAEPGRPLSLLVLDEPTPTFSRGEVCRLHGIVRAAAAGGAAVLYVTHRLDEVFDVADEVSVLRDGRKVATCRTGEVGRDDLITLLVGGVPEHTGTRSESRTVRADEAGAPALEVHGLAAGSVRGVGFTVRSGEIVGVAGATGSGRETLLGSLFGAVPRQAGTVRLGGRALPAERPDLAIEAGAAYLPSDRVSLGGMQERSARENLTLVDLRPFWRPPVLRRRKEVEQVRSWFDALRIRPAGGFEKNLGEFSGGNQQKILLAKWLRCKTSVLLLDEPTHGVDVAAQALLRRELQAAADDGCAVLFSSSDLEEVAGLADRVLVMRSGRITAVVDRIDLSVATLSRLCLGTDAEPGTQTPPEDPDRLAVAR